MSGSRLSREEKARCRVKMLVEETPVYGLDPDELALVENEELVGVMRQVVRVRDDVCGTEVVRALAPLAPEQRDALEAFGTTWGLGGVVERLTAALSR
jgi:hypothetical protein